MATDQLQTCLKDVIVKYMGVQLGSSKGKLLTKVMSLEAAAALMCREGCLTELEQSSARANVPTDLQA